MPQYRSLDVAGPESGGQVVAHPVRDVPYVAQIREPVHREDWPEDLFLGDSPVWLGVIEEIRLSETILAERRAGQ